MIDDSQEIQNDTPQSGNDAEATRRRSRRRGRRGKSRGAVPTVVEQQPDTAREAEAAPPAPSPQRHTPHREVQRTSDYRHAARSGFGDELDRQVCAMRMPGYPSAWPVNYRVGIAMQPLAEVGRSEGTVLLCDLSHDGPCVWPGYLGTEENRQATPPPKDATPAPTVVDLRDEENEAPAATATSGAIEDDDVTNEMEDAGSGTEPDEDEN
jgi:hypothetical protein